MSRASRINCHRHQFGVSLVELMVSIVVALLLIAGVIQVYLTTKQSYNAQAQLARMQESGRFAMDLITRDLRRAGFWGGNVDTTTIGGIPGRSVPPQNCSAGTAEDWATAISWRVEGVDNGNAGYACATGYNADTDILAVRYAGPEPLATFASDNTLFLRSTLFAGRIMRGNNESSNTLPPSAAGTPTHLLPQVRRLVANAYFIADSATDTCNGRPVPALHRLTLVPGGGIGVEEIAPGVEQLQVQYLLNNAYVDASAVGLNWPQVSAVRVWLLARSNCPEQGLDNPATFDIGNVSWPNAPDNFRRQLYVTTTMLRNTLVR